MKTATLTALTLILNLTPTAHAEIHDIASMRQITNSIGSDTMVIFDIDNTLIEPVQTLGSDQWFGDVLQSSNLQNALKEWVAVGEKTRVRPVERFTPSMIAGLQAQGNAVFALTARTADQEAMSARQIRSVGIDMTRTAPRAVAAHQGILFVSPTGDKGQNLVSFLNHNGLHPSKIVFVDDKLKNVQSVETALDQAGIRNIEFRYGAADERVRAYNHDIATTEWNIFEQTGRIVSDSEAAQHSGR